MRRKMYNIVVGLVQLRDPARTGAGCRLKLGRLRFA